MKINFDKFSVEYPVIDSPILSFKEECRLAAHNAYSKNINNLPVVVLMSGGIDSQLVAESLLLAGIQFKCVIGRLCTVIANSKKIIFNEHDYSYAMRWCNDHNIDILYCDIDIYKSAELLSEYVLSANGFSPQYACHMFIMKWCNDNSYFFIAGNGEMDIVLKDEEYYMLDEQREFTLLNFCESYNLQGEFQFWKQDSRIISAFIELPTVERLMSNRVSRILDYKHECFSDIFTFEFRNKHTGFEFVQEWDSVIRNHLKQLTGQYDCKYYTHINQFKYACP